MLLIPKQQSLLLMMTVVSVDKKLGFCEILVKGKISVYYTRDKFRNVTKDRTKPKRNKKEEGVSASN